DRPRMGECRLRTYGSMKRCIIAVLAASALAAGCGSSPKSAAPSSAAVSHALAGSPPALASLHSQANRLLNGGPGAFKARLAALKGHPVVVNKWASWCGPCRAEFPMFQKLGVQLGRNVGFIGVNTQDNE